MTTVAQHLQSGTVTLFDNRKTEYTENFVQKRPLFIFTCSIHSLTTWVSMQFINGTPAWYRLSRTMQIISEEDRAYILGFSKTM